MASQEVGEFFIKYLGEPVMTLGQRLREIRKEKNLTQKQIAVATGKTDRHYQRIEYDEISPSVDFLVALSDCLDMSIDEIMGRRRIAGGDKKILPPEKRCFVYASVVGLESRAHYEIARAIWDTGCFLTGMFAPVMADKEFSILLSRIMEDCDYYILIDGGVSDLRRIEIVRAELRCAFNIDIPRLAFVKNSLIKSSERNDWLPPEAETKNFVSCHQWSDVENLTCAIGKYISRLKKNNAPRGWIRGDEITKEQLLLEHNLRAKIDTLENRVRELEY
jgi:transcriptional regulator with XRE-family HTH domain